MSFKSKQMRRSHIHVRPGMHCGTGLLGRCLNVGLKVGKHPLKIPLASIHRDLTEEDIRSVFSAFGTIKDCDMAKYAQHLIYTSIGVK